MKRRIIEIDSEKCNGCGACAEACHEGAIAMIDGKARLIKDDYCDGLGDCLPVCPTDAISFVEREAAPYDEAAVKARMGSGCPGQALREIQHEEKSSSISGESRLRQWPVQIKLVPVNAPYFDNADLLIAADCTAFAYGAFHDEFIKDRITLIGCPKLDDIDYSEKLAAIFGGNRIRSITVVRMEVPCCGGLQYAVTNALAKTGKDIPLNVVTVGIDGKLK